MFIVIFYQHARHDLAAYGHALHAGPLVTLAASALPLP